MVAALEEAVWRRVEELGVRRRIYVDPSWRFQGTGAYRGPDPPCITWLLKGVVKGLRHDAAIRLLSYWINFRHERPKAALDKAKDWNRRNEEPLPEQELADIYKDVVKEPYNYGCTDTLYRCGCNPANCEIGKHKPSEEALTKAEAFMKDPVGFIQYLQQCLEYRLTGEQKNRLFIFLVAAGAGVQTSVIRITGPNSVGKNQLIRWLQEFFGADRVIAISSATVNWLKRKVMRGLDTRGKIFILLEERGEREGAFKYQFEQIYSEDKVIIGLNVRDKETGEWEPVEVELQGPLCFITTSTELETSLHAKTREWEVYPDDSEAQTRRIDAWINWRELLPLKRLEEEKQEIAVVKAYLSLLKPHRDYRLPFIDRIDFKSRTLEDRRKKNDFINLMKYACHVFQGSLPIDSETDTVFALPFIFSFVMTIADEIIFTSRGGLTRNEKRILDYLQEHPEIYKVTAEGKVPKKRIRQGTLGQEELDYDEKPIGVRASDLIETGEFEDIHENTVKNALSGLARKRYLLVLKDSGRGTPKVYGKPLRSNLVVNSESQQKALLPEMRPFPVDFLSSQVHKILYGEVPQPSERQTRNRGLIETCQLVNFEISPETALFQPKWALSELFK